MREQTTGGNTAETNLTDEKTEHNAHRTRDYESKTGRDKH